MAARRRTELQWSVFKLLMVRTMHCRERIPERVVHARGMSAKGVFEVTHDVTDLTFADFLSEASLLNDCESNASLG